MNFAHIVMISFVWICKSAVLFVIIPIKKLRFLIARLISFVIDFYAGLFFKRNISSPTENVNLNSPPDNINLKPQSDKEYVRPIISDNLIVSSGGNKMSLGIIAKAGVAVVTAKDLGLKREKIEEIKPYKIKQFVDEATFKFDEISISDFFVRIAIS